MKDQSNTPIETIDMSNYNNDGQYFFIAATVLAEKLSGKKQTVEEIAASRKQHNDSFEVKFEVNGVSLPFNETINEIFNRYRAYIDEEASKKALELVAEAGFDDLVETIKGAKWQIVEKFKEKGIILEDNQY